VVSQMLGIWFLATAMGNFMGGQGRRGVREVSPADDLRAVAAVCFLLHG